MEFIFRLNCRGATDCEPNTKEDESNTYWIVCKTDSITCKTKCTFSNSNRYSIPKIENIIDKLKKKEPFNNEHLVDYNPDSEKKDHNILLNDTQITINKITFNIESQREQLILFFNSLLNIIKNVEATINYDSLPKIDKYKRKFRDYKNEEFPQIVKEGRYLHWFHSWNRFHTFVYSDILISKLKEIIYGDKLEIIVDGHYKLTKYNIGFHEKKFNYNIDIFDGKFYNTTNYIGQHFDDKMIAKLDSIEEL